MSNDSHLSILQVVRLADKTIDPADRSAAATHIETCPDCRSLAEGYAALRRLARNLSRPDPPKGLQKEVEELAETIAAHEADRLRRRRRLAVAASLIAAVSATAILVALVGWARGGGPKILESPTPVPSALGTSTPGPDATQSTIAGPRPAFVDRGRSYSDSKAVEEALREDATIRQFRDYYTAQDVGSNQRPMQALLAEFAGSTPGRSPAECMNVVLRAVPRPILPAYVEKAKFQGTDAWIMVFVYAPDSAPETHLTGVIFYAMATEDCTFLGTAFWS
jgi:predicted anti-sigma-YlaC factor YlaD